MGKHISLKSQLQTQATEDTRRREQKTDRETSLQDDNVIVPRRSLSMEGRALEQEGVPEFIGTLGLEGVSEPGGVPEASGVSEQGRAPEASRVSEQRGTPELDEAPESGGAP